MRPEQSAPVRVLIAEDDPTLQILLRAQLTRLGYAVVGCASDGLDAVSQARALHPDLLLLDIHLTSGLDGIEVARQVREHVDCAVVFLTSASDAATLDRAREVRPHGYAVKPVVVAALNASLQVALDGASYQRELRALEERMREQAGLDLLTGLPNRRGLATKYEKAVARAQRAGITFALVYIDLDHFKQVNDHFGHEAGDAVIVEFGRRLTGTLRVTDVVARVGGDEFVLLAEDLPSTDLGASLPESLERIGRRVCAAFDEALTWQGQPTGVTASVGVVAWTGPRDELESLMRRADEVMYEVKRSGRNGWRVVELAQ